MALGSGTGYGVGLAFRVLLTSDYHKLSVAVGDQKGQALKWHEKIVEGIIDRWKIKTVAVAIPRLWKAIEENGPYQKVFVNGDAIEAEYNERGMIGRCDMIEMRLIKERLKLLTGGGNPVFVPGDHELGYKLPLSSDPSGGISEKSIRNFEEECNRIVGHIALGNVHFLWLCSSLFSQPIGHLPEDEQLHIKKLHWHQCAVIASVINAAEKDGSVFLFLHDPDALEKVDELLSLKDKAKIAAVFCGHMHATESLVGYARLGKFAQTKISALLAKVFRRWRMIHEGAKGNLRRLELFKQYNLQIIPAPGGMMGKGGGFLVLNIYDDGSYQIEKHTI